MSTPDASVDPPRTPVTASEAAISAVLRIGVVSSVLLMLVGTVISFVRHPEYLGSRGAHERLTRSEAAPHRLGDVFHGLATGRGQSIVSLGVLVLIATPVIRVALSILIFAHQRDRRFTVITAVVLALLILSFALGRAGG